MLLLSLLLFVAHALVLLLLAGVVKVDAALVLIDDDGTSLSASI